jgi:hypothetical protein
MTTRFICAIARSTTRTTTAKRIFRAALRLVKTTELATIWWIFRISLVIVRTITLELIVKYRFPVQYFLVKITGLAPTRKISFLMIVPAQKRIPAKIAK